VVVINRLFIRAYRINPRL